MYAITRNIEGEYYNSYPLPHERLYPEIWRNVDLRQFGYDNDQTYIVSNYGVVYDFKTGDVTPYWPIIEYNRYERIRIRSNNGHYYTLPVHRIVMMMFKPILEYEDMEVNHIDGIKCHNWLWNLEWVTPSQNIRHAIRTGLAKSGEERYGAKHTETQIRKLCELIGKGFTNKQICDMFGSSFNDEKLSVTLCNLRRKHCWAFISDEYDWTNASHIKENNSNKVFTDEQAHAICKYLEKDNSARNMQNVLMAAGIDYNNLPRDEKGRYCAALSMIRRRLHYTNISKDYNF